MRCYYHGGSVDAHATSTLLRQQTAPAFRAPDESGRAAPRQQLLAASGIAPATQNARPTEQQAPLRASLGVAQWPGHQGTSELGQGPWPLGHAQRSCAPWRPRIPSVRTQTAGPPWMPPAQPPAALANSAAAARCTGSRRSRGRCRVGRGGGGAGGGRAARNGARGPGAPAAPAPREPPRWSRQHHSAACAHSARAPPHAPAASTSHITQPHHQISRMRGCGAPNAALRPQARHSCPRAPEASPPTP